MQTFKDQSGKVWNVAVTPYERDRVLERGIELYDIVDKDKAGAFVSDLESNDAFLVDVMCGVCAEQYEALGIEETEFKRQLYGESLNEALEALLKAYPLFFRSPVERAMVAKLLEAMQQAAAKQGDIVKFAENRCDELISREMEQMTPEIIQKTLDQELPAPSSTGSAGKRSRRSNSNGKSKARTVGNTQRTN